MLSWEAYFPLTLKVLNVYLRPTLQHRSPTWGWWCHFQVYAVFSYLLQDACNVSVMVSSSKRFVFHLKGKRYSEEPPGALCERTESSPFVGTAHLIKNANILMNMFALTVKAHRTWLYKKKELLTWGLPWCRSLNRSFVLWKWNYNTDKTLSSGAMLVVITKLFSR